MARGKQSHSIFTALGAATGLGNALRFPSLCALYGGGFVVAYIVCLALVCFPLLCAELYIGKRYAQSFQKSLSECSPRMSPLAYCAAINCAVIALYYGVISAKIGGAFACLAAIGGVADLSGHWLIAVGALSLFFAWLILRGKPSVMANTGRVAVLSSLSLFAVLCIAVIARGGNALAIFCFAFSDLMHGGLWADALGQSLLALSLAGGVMPTFARSFKEGFAVAPTSAKIIAANLSGCILAAVAALSLSLPVPGEGGVTLALGLYPQVIAAAFSNPVLFRIFSALFFASLWLVAIQSTCSLFSPVISCAEENHRKLAITFCCVLSLALIPLFAANGGAAMQAADRMACSVNAVIIAFLEAVIFLYPRNMPQLKGEIGVFPSLLLRSVCPLACGALALFSACGARFSSFPSYAVACAIISLALVFSPFAVRFAQRLTKFAKRRIIEGRGGGDEGYA